MRNKLLVTALLIVLPLFVTACTASDLPVVGKYLANINLPFLNSGTKSGGTITLNVWGLWEKPEVMAVLVNKYQETHPNVKITYDDRSVMNVNDYKDTVVSRAGQKDAPDIVLVHDSWLGDVKSSLSPMPSGLMDAKTYAQTFYPVATQAAVDGDNIYAVPMYYDGLVMVYNKKQFNEVSQTAPPTAWEEFRRLAAALTVRGDQGTIVRAGAAIGNATNVDFSTDILGMMFAQAGVSVPKDLDSRAAQDALTFYTNFVTQDKVWDSTFSEASAAFAQEKVSMIFIPTWNLVDILTLRPDLDIGVAPVPQATPTDPTSWGSFWMYAVPNGSNNKAAAWEFISFLSKEDQQLAMFNEASKYRNYGAPYSLVNMASQLDSNPYLKPLLDTAPYAKISPLAARSGNKIYSDAMKKAISDVVSGKSAADALKEAKATVTAAH